MKGANVNTSTRNIFLSSIALTLLLTLLPARSASAARPSSVSLNFFSIGTMDGWVRESTETSNAGGALNFTNSTFLVGDDAGNRQFRTILSFNTGSIPDGATITVVKLKIKRQGVTGTNPFTTHGALRLDIRKPFFGAANTLELADFQAGATKLNAGQFSSTPVSGGSAYQAVLPSTSLQYINKAGLTQIRLRFTLDDNNDFGADNMRFFSGNYTVVSDRPELEVQYNP
jgi:hypothetical protein